MHMHTYIFKFSEWHLRFMCSRTIYIYAYTCMYICVYEYIYMHIYT